LQARRCCLMEKHSAPRPPNWTIAVRGCRALSDAQDSENPGGFPQPCPHRVAGGLQHASDSEILHAATTGERVIIYEDTDLGALLAHRQLSQPSFVLLRSVEPLTPQRYSTADDYLSDPCRSIARILSRAPAARVRRRTGLSATISLRVVG
jgi:hypothetical protein